MTNSTWSKNRIENRNFLQPNGFKLSLEIFPKVSFYCQTANIPGISLTEINIPTPYRDYPVPGTETLYEDFRLSFLVDEDFQNYSSIHKWLRETGLALGPDSTTDPKVSKGYLEILNSNLKPSFTVDFDDMWPISLSTLDFSAAVTDIDYFVAEVTFKYTIYRIKDKNGKVIS